MTKSRNTATVYQGTIHIFEPIRRNTALTTPHNNDSTIQCDGIRQCSTSSAVAVGRLVRRIAEWTKGATTVLKLGGPSAEGAELSAEGVGRGGLPRNFLSENGEFWCIIVGAPTVYVI